MTDEPKRPHDQEEPEPGDEPNREPSTEEQFALEADVSGPPTDEHFEGVPPDQISRGDLTEDIPALEPEFAEALRAAGDEPPSEEAAAGNDESGAGNEGSEEEGGEESEPAEPVAAAEPAAPAAPPTPAPQAADPGETVEYSPGDAPDDQPYAGDDAGKQPDTPAPSADPSLDRTVVLREGREEARKAVAAATETGRPWAPKRPPASGDPEPPPKRKRLWLRYFAASMIVIASFASATTAIGVLRLTTILNRLTPIPGIAGQLKKVEPGEPETFLIIGSDIRAADAAAGARGLSDTTILLRIDPDQNRIAILNIPRDLKVDIPGYGVDKFNAAYSLGGPQLTVKTIKSITRSRELPNGIPINHLVNVDFLGFAQAIDTINCVYVDVDRRYYHSNEGVPPEDQYSEINIQPGYQSLCGRDGLAYVRYRHTDTDLVRAARQQDFLREARQRVPPTELLKEATGLSSKLINAFTSHTQSDIKEPSTIIDVLKLMIGARGAPIKEIHFPATLGPSYVTASRSDISDAIQQFLRGEASGGPRGSLYQRGSSAPARAKGSAGGQGGAKPKKKKPPKEKAPPTPTSASDGLVDASSAGLEEAQRAARHASTDFPIYYPTRIPPGSEYDDGEPFSTNPRVYHLTDDDDNVYGAYKTVLAQFASDGTHYFGVQGLHAWQDPPALNDPSESRKIGKLDCDIFLDGDRVRMISWHDGDNSYWLSNDLLQTLTNDQMLGMVRSMKVVVPKEKARPRGKKQ